MDVEEVLATTQTLFGDLDVDHLWSVTVSALGDVGIEEVLSATLGALALLSTHLAGERRRSAWVVGLISQVGWLAFMFVSSNFGFIVSFVGFTIVYLKNLRKWTKNPPARYTPNTSPTDASSPPGQTPPCSCRHAADLVPA